MKLTLLTLISLFSFFVSAKSIVLTEKNSVSINQPITSSFISKKTVEVLNKAAKLPIGSDLYLVLNTPGGEVFAGMLFVDTLKSLHVKVHTITIFAASMGYQFAQHLGQRYIITTGTLMSHRAAVGGVGGQINGELNSRVQFFTDVSNVIDAISAKRVGQSLEAYQKSIINELWVVGADAVAKGHADDLAQVSCDKELAEGTKSEEIETMFGTLKATFSKCPLIVAPLDISSSNKRAKERVRSFYSDMSQFIKIRL